MVSIIVIRGGILELIMSCVVACVASSSVRAEGMPIVHALSSSSRVCEVLLVVYVLLKVKLKDIDHPDRKYKLSLIIKRSTSCLIGLFFF